MYEDAKGGGDWCAEDDGKLWSFVRRHEERVEWAIGDRQPPPGLKNPGSEEEALEAFEAVL